MKASELQGILFSDKKLSIKEVQNILYELKQDCFNQIHKGLNEDKEQWYRGEINAFFICLDLLEKVESNEIQEQEEAYEFDVMSRVECNNNINCTPIKTLKVFKDEVSSIEINIKNDLKVRVDLKLKGRQKTYPPTQQEKI